MLRCGIGMSFNDIRSATSRVLAPRGRDADYGGAANRGLGVRSFATVAGRTRQGQSVGHQSLRSAAQRFHVSFAETAGTTLSIAEITVPVCGPEHRRRPRDRDRFVPPASLPRRRHGAIFSNSSITTLLARREGSARKSRLPRGRRQGPPNRRARDRDRSRCYTGSAARKGLRQHHGL